MKIIYLGLITLATCLCANAQQELEAAAKLTIESFFEGFHKGDTTLMRTMMGKELIMQTAYRNKAGKDVLRTGETVETLLLAVASRPPEQVWDERLLRYNIRIDGNMAHVWVPYQFWLNGEFSHCGVNSFQLFSDNGQWKIIYLIDTRRRDGCGVQ